MAERPKRSRTKPPSMYDVARRAGVSQTTVSFVVNDVANANLPAETRERVWAAIKELGWRPNAMARGLSLRQSQTIGFISDEIATTSHAGKIIQGAQDAAWAHDKLLLVIDVNQDRRREQRAIEMMLERQVEGLIYATMYHHAVRLDPIETDIPIMLLDCFDNEGLYPAIIPDEVQGGRIATEALITRGHRRIGFINNSDPIPAAVGRLEGYRAALAAAGLPFDEHLVCAGPSSGTTGFHCTQELFLLPEPPTALFCFSDVIAMGAYDALKQRGLRIPDDVAVVGFDNLEVVAAHVYPPLSTVELPHYEMGRRAINGLLAAEPGPRTVTRHLVPCRFIERSSTPPLVQG